MALQAQPLVSPITLLITMFGTVCFNALTFAFYSIVSTDSVQLIKAWHLTLFLVDHGLGCLPHRHLEAWETCLLLAVFRISGFAAGASRGCRKSNVSKLWHSNHL